MRKFVKAVVGFSIGVVMGSAFFMPIYDSVEQMQGSPNEGHVIPVLRRIGKAFWRAVYWIVEA